jgi:Zn finger protein HypA/HybF involved in hydrogenase expression
MAQCPQCNMPLRETLTPVGVTYDCPSCGGRNVALAVLRKAGAFRT